MSLGSTSSQNREEDKTHSFTSMWLKEQKQKHKKKFLISVMVFEKRIPRIGIYRVHIEGRCGGPCPGYKHAGGGCEVQDKPGLRGETLSQNRKKQVYMGFILVFVKIKF